MLSKGSMGNKFIKALLSSMCGCTYGCGAADKVNLPYGPDFNGLFDGSSENPLANKYYVITGANTGIGKETALRLYGLGANVIIGCRNVQKGEEAVNSIKAAHPNSVGSIQVFQLDLSKFPSIFNFAKNIKETFPRVDVLINNAGSNLPEFNTDYNISQLFLVNYLGHYYLFNCLLSHLQSKDGEAAPDNARVINTSSVMHHMGQRDFKASATGFKEKKHVKTYQNKEQANLRKQQEKEIKRREKEAKTGEVKEYEPIDLIDVLNEEKVKIDKIKNESCTYSDSKLYLNLFTMAINHLYDFDLQKPYSTGAVTPTIPFDANIRPIIALSVNPGAVASDIWRHDNTNNQDCAMKHLHKRFLPVDLGAKTTIYAAIIPDKIIRDYQTQTKEKINRKMKNVDLLSTKKSHLVVGESVFRPDLPYLSPYNVKNNISREIFGPFYGPNFTPATLPHYDGSDKKFMGYHRANAPENFDGKTLLSHPAASALWKYSNQLCTELQYAKVSSDTPTTDVETESKVEAEKVEAEKVEAEKAEAEKVEKAEA